MCSKKALVGTIWVLTRVLTMVLTQVLTGVLTQVLTQVFEPGFDPGFDPGFVLKKGHKKDDAHKYKTLPSRFM